MSWTSWSARLSSLALRSAMPLRSSKNLPKVLANQTNQLATCFKVALESSANIFRYCLIAYDSLSQKMSPCLPPRPPKPE